MRLPHIGIIGIGVVGHAVAVGCYPCRLSTYDKFKPELTSEMGSFPDSTICFVCVPTPSTESGQDLSAVYDAVKMLNEMSYKGVVVIKSTVRPGTMAQIACLYPKVRLVHNPEFLTEKNAKKDFITQPCVLLSGREADTSEVAAFYRIILRHKYDILDSTNYETTEFAKYIHNCMLPVALSFLNEIYSLCSGPEVFRAAVEMANEFGNLPKHHQVPGPDGKRGWGGMCFTKDSLALLRLAEANGVDMPTLAGAIKTNKSIRPSAYDGTEKNGLT